MSGPSPNHGFDQASDTAQFVRNVARWFTGGGTGNFLVYSSNQGLTGSDLEGTMQAAGHTWTVDTSITVSLSNLQQYDAVFLAQDEIDNQVLIDYVNAGGNVYLAGGTMLDAQAEADQWNTFLNAFGLTMDASYNGVDGVLATTSGHPIFDRVSGLFQDNGSNLSLLDPNAAGPAIIAQDQGLNTFTALGGASTLPSDQEHNPECQCNEGNPNMGGPFNVRTGNLWTSVNDLAVETLGPAIQFSRTYNSQQIDETTEPLGFGWQHSFQTRLITETMPGGEPGRAIILSPQGNRLRFEDRGDGSFRSLPGIYSTLVQAGGVYTQTLGQTQQQYVFDGATGHLAAVRDALGRTITLTYDNGTGLLTQITDAGDTTRFLELSYTLDGRLESVSDGIRTVSYNYDGAGDLVGVTDVMGRTTTYLYTNHLLTGIDNALNQPLERTVYDAYTAEGRVVEQTLQNGRQLDVTYLDTTTIITTTTPDGLQNVNRYDFGPNNLVRSIEQNGQVMQTRAADPFLNPAEIGDANSNATQVSANINGQPLSVTDALGQTSTTIYDSHNRPITNTNTLGSLTTFTYDARGNLVNTTTGISDPPSIATTTIYTYTYDVRYAGDSLLAARQAPDGVVTSYSYDSAGRVTEMTIGDGTSLAQTTGYGYDALGRVVTTTLGLGTALERQDVTHYNADNTVAETIQNYQDGIFDPAQPDTDVITSYGYDALGRQVWMKDPLDRMQAVHYDQAGRLDWTIANLMPQSIDSAGLPIFADFDPDSPLENRATLYQYDGLGRTVLVTQTGILTGSFDLGTQRFTDATTRTTRTEYDALSRPITVTLNYRPNQIVGAAPDVNVQTVTHYDAAGNITWERDALGRWTHTEYDALNRPITTTLNYENGDPLTVDVANQSWTDGSDTDLITVVQYDEAGRITSQIDNYVDGVFTITEPITDRITLFTYDPSGFPLTTTQNADPNTLGLRSDTNRTNTTAYNTSTGQVVGQQDPLGRWVSSQYDLLGRVATTIQNCRDTSGNSSPDDCAAFDPDLPDRNVPTTRHYDALGRAFETVDALGQVTRTSYDGLGRMIVTTQNYNASTPADEETNVTTERRYDALGRTLVVTDALGLATTYHYDSYRTIMTDSANRITRSSPAESVGAHWTVDAGGRATVTLIDGLGRPLANIQNYQDGEVGPSEPSDQDLITRTIYDAGGRRVLTIDPSGRRTAFVYDNLDRLTMVAEYGPPQSCPIWMVCNLPLALTRYAYDRAGNRTAIVDANSHARRFSYDAASQQRLSIDPLGYTTVYTYDQGGRLTHQGDPRGADYQLSFAYDGLDRLTQTSALDVDRLSPISAEYDALGRRTLLEDSSGTTSFAYDPLGRMTEVQLTPAGQSTQTIGYGYDARGARTMLIYPDSTQINYDYRSDGLLQQLTQGASSPTLLASYSYDTVGRLAHVARSNGAVTSYSYDGADRIRRITTSVGGATAADFEYAVDRLGLRTAITETLPLTLTGGFPVTGVLDDFNRADGAPGSNWSGASGTYNIEDNALTNVGGDAGALFWDTSFGAEQEIAFTLSETDANGDEIDLLLKGQSTSPCDVIEVLYQPRSSTVQVWTCHNYGTWLAHGAPISATLEAGDRFGARASADGTVTIYQNEEAIGSVVISSDWPYRAEGGRVGVWLLNAQGAVLDDFSGGTITPPPAPTPTRVTTYNYDGLLRLIGAQESPGTTYHYSYDSAGNQTGQWVNGTRTITRTYNAANQVVGWTYDQAGNLTGDGTATYSYDALNRMTASDSTSYAYNGDGVLMAQTVSGVTTRYTQDLATPLSQVLHITQGSSITHYIYGMERLAAVSGGTSTWYVADALGSVRRMMSDAGEPGSPVYYDPWGQVESGSVSPFGFTGELQDSGVELLYLRARWYRPLQGQFISRDPWQGSVEEPQTLTYYQYVHNNPINFIDPTGKVRWRGTGSRYHELIEDAYMLTNPADIHVEFDWLPLLRVDVINSATGDVYEIEPINKIADALPQAGGYVVALNTAGSLMQLDPIWTGFPKRSLPPNQWVNYHWNQVWWWFGASARFPPMRLTRWLGFADLVAISPSDGVIVYWLEPKNNTQQAWNDLLANSPNKLLNRPFGWQPGQPTTPPGAPQPAPPAPPGPGTPPGPGIPPIPIPPVIPPPMPLPRGPLGGGGGAGGIGGGGSTLFPCR